jgi:hypothetical protein
MHPLGAKKTRMIGERLAGHILLTTLGKNWCMVGARGALAILFGVLLVLRPAMTLGRPGVDRGSNRVHVHLGWYGSSLRATSNPVIG